MVTPEARARENIDSQLANCGWILQNRSSLNLRANCGIAVREFPLETGVADYLLFVNEKAVGVIEAKSEGMPLAGVAEQAGLYAVGLPENIPHVSLPLPYVYESTGVETFFRDNRDPEPRSRHLFTFHRPETLADWIAQADTLRSRLRDMPERRPLIANNLWLAQVEAITKLERSFAADHPRALIQMATGSGKTFTTVNFVYRLVKHAKARRVLFLVDRNNLGRQAFKEFDQFVTPDDGRKFTELYNVQHLQSNVLDDVSKVHITTIQRLYSMLSGEAEFDPANEEGSLWEVEAALSGQPEKLVRYNPRIPIEYYDFIITDECHRSIYNLWRQVFEYFDASIIGLTATPSKQTFGFFNQNLVMEYPRQRAVADGVNVDGEVYRIRTRITEQGSTIEKGWWVGRRNKRTRRERWEQLDEDLSYDPQDLDRQVTSKSQIRTILQAYQDSLPELFPGRNEVPKTLVFAKDDNHAEEIVRIAREVFGKGDDFCQKITYRTTGEPENLISAFRTSYYPRIAVTVDMIATGTDIKPLEALVFMRPVRSRVLFEQMLGRGTRVISDTDFQSVTTAASARKTRFVIVDAVGVTEQELIETGTVERKRTLPLKSLLESIALGVVDDDLMASLARRLGLMEKRLNSSQRQEVAVLLGKKPAPEPFSSLGQLANAFLDAIDPDLILENARSVWADGIPPYSLHLSVGADGVRPWPPRWHPPLSFVPICPSRWHPPRRYPPRWSPDGCRPDPSREDQIESARRQLVQRAVVPLAANPEPRDFLLQREILIDETSIDELVSNEFDPTATVHARQLIRSFEKFIQDNKDEITALQILFGRPYGQRHLEFPQVRELAERLNAALQQNDPLYLTEALWQAYARLEKDRVHGAGERRILADLVSLVRHAALDEELEPYPERVQRRYREWLAAQESQGIQFSLLSSAGGWTRSPVTSASMFR